MTIFRGAGRYAESAFLSQRLLALRVRIEQPPDLAAKNSSARTTDFVPVTEYFVPRREYDDDVALGFSQRRTTTFVWAPVDACQRAANQKKTPA